MSYPDARHQNRPVEISNPVFRLIRRPAGRATVFLFLAMAAALGTFSLATAVGRVATAPDGTARSLKAVNITAAKTYAFIGGDGDGKADPGETVKYTVAILNSGTTGATGVWYDDDPDLNTTYVDGSLAAAPVAVDDTFPVVVLGNVSINSAGLAVPFSVTANDFPGVNPAATITTYDAVTAQGGQVVMTTSGAGMGMFTYDPPAGFEGTDAFTYTLADNADAPSAAAYRTATVSITVSGMVWFINNNAPVCASDGCGRLSNPFSSLAAFQLFNDGTGNHPANDDNIFIFQSATPYNGAVTLLPGQKLIGQDATASLSAITGLTPPTGSPSFPAMNSADATVTNLSGTVTLNTNTTVRGLQINSAAATGLTDPAGAISGVSVSDISVTTTTGTAVSLSNAGGVLVFNRISSNGAANGISLTATTGSFTVNGDGVDTTPGGNGSGGTIQNISGADGSSAGNGVYLSNVQNVTLRRMHLANNANFAVSGATVNGFTMEYCTLDGVNGTNPVIYDEGSVAFTGLTGTASIRSTIIQGGIEDNFRVTNTAGTLNRITFDTLSLGANSTANGNAGILLDASGSATLNATVQNSVFTASRADLFHLNLSGNAVSDLVFHSNTLSNNHPAIATGGGGLTLGAGNNTGSVNLTFNIDGNTFRDANGHGVLIFKSTDPGTVQGTFSNNTIGVAAVANSGSVNGDGIKIQNAGLGTVSVRVANNRIYQYNNFGIQFLTGGGAAPTGGSLNATVVGNTVSNPGTGGLPMNGIHLNGGTVPGDTYAICMDIGGAGALANAITGSGANGGTDVRVRQRMATTVTLPGYGGANNDNAAVQTYLSGRNGGGTALASNSVPTGGGFIGGAACLQPITKDSGEDLVAALALAEAADAVPAGADAGGDEAAGRVRTLTLVGSARAATPVKPPVPAGSRPAEQASAAPASPSGEPGKFAKASTEKAGGIVSVNIGTLPSGKGLTVTYRVTVNGPSLPLGTLTLTNQGTVSYDPGQTTPTDDPAVPGAGDPTVIPVDRPDTTVLSIALAGGNPTNAPAVSWTVTFADPLLNLTASNFALVTGGGLGGIPAITGVVPNTAAPTVSWTVTASTGTGDGTLGLNLANDAGLSHDVTNVPFTGPVFTLDRTPPTVTLDQAVGQVDPTNLSPIHFTVVFSEPVTGFAPAAVTLGGTAGATTAVVTGGPTVFDVAVSGMTGDGTVTASIDAGKVTDPAGNPNAASTSGDNTVTYDATPPAILSFTRFNPAASPTNADVLIFRVQFSERVYGIDAASFAVNGATTAGVSGVVMINTSGLYEVTLSGGDLAAFNGTVGLNFSGTASLSDAAGNAFVVVEPPVDETYLVDNTPPDVTINQAAGQNDPTNAGPINFTVVFSEPVTGFAGGAVILGGTAGATTAVVTGGPTVFNVAVSGMTGDGTVTASIAAGAATDLAGNSSAASTSTDNSVTYDTTMPDTTLTGNPPDPSSSSSATFTFTGSDPGGSGVDFFECRLDGGAWSASPSPTTYTGLGGGSHTFEVRAVDMVGNRDPSPASYTWLIKFDTTTSLASSPNPSAIGQNVTLTATVTSGTGTPTGTVDFFDGAALLGTAPLSGGTAVFNTSALTGGTHALTAAYSGSAGYNPSTSAAVTQTVDASAIGNRVWLDNGVGGGTANDGIQNGTEPGAPNVTVELYSVGSPTPLATTTTDAAGRYQFDDLAPGDYVVKIPAGQFQAGGPLRGYVSSFGNGADKVSDQDVDENGLDQPDPAVTGVTGTVFALAPHTERTGEDQSNYTGSLPDDEVNFTCDFGFVEATAVGNLVWLDNGAGGGTANDGIRNGTEPGVPGVSVELYRDGTPAPVLTTVTDALGRYQFDNLTPGNYTVTIPAGQFQVGGPLLGYVSSPGNGTDQTSDQDVDENGLDQPNPSLTGITSTVFALSPHTLRTGEDQSNYTGILTDDSVNFTCDFGFMMYPTTTALASSPNPSVFGQSVAVTATVSSTGGTPTGTVRFYDGVTLLGSLSLSGGSATLNTSALAAGTHPLTAVYEGTPGFQGSTSPVVNQVVNPAATLTGLVSAPNPSSFGQSVTLTATVSSAAGTPPGSVSFFDGATLIGTGVLDPGGVATMSTAALVGGTHMLSATYNGTADFLPSFSGPLNHTVNPAATATGLVSAPNPSTFGQSVTLTATVSSAAGTPTGTVTFFDGAVSLGTGSLDGGGVATLTTAALTGGTHVLTAAYGATPNYAASTSAPLTQTVNPAATTTAVTAAPNPSRFGENVTFSATVTASPGIPTGSVQFAADGVNVGGPVALAGGTATVGTAALDVGLHTVTAEYLPGGDPNYAGSTGTLAGGQTVQKAGTTTTVASVPNPSRFGQSVTFTATVAVVAPGAGTPTGTVTFLDGAATLGTGTLVGNTATFSTSALAVAAHAITARYEGDASFDLSTSAPLTQTVDRADTTTAVTSAPNPSRFGQSVTFTATVSVVAPGTGTPTGTVTFLDGAVTLGTGTLVGNTATFSTAALAVAAHTLTARYEGDASFNLSISPPLTQTVDRADTTTAVTSAPNPSRFGQSVTFTATVAVSAPGAGTPTGTVTFLNGAASLGTGTLVGNTATFSTAALAVAAHTITARYDGDASFNLSTSAPLTQTVDKADTTTSLTAAPNPTRFGQPVTFTATVAVVAPGAGTPTGTVTFLDGATTLGTGTLVGTTATFSTSALAVAAHTITARYDGDASFNLATSAPLTQTVDKADTTTNLTSAPNPTRYGQSVTFTATVAVVAPGAGTPGGTVSFLEGATVLGTGTLSGGTATFTTATLPVGPHAVTAHYDGDASFNISTSAPVTQTVDPADTTTALASSVNPSVWGQAVTFTATVAATAPGAGTPTGTVTFLDGATPLGTGTLSGNTAAFTTAALSVATHPVTARYEGDGSFNPSVSPAVNQVVDQAATTTALASSPNPVCPGVELTLTATVVVTAPGAGTPGGTVTFLDGATPLGTGILAGTTATFTTTALTTGTHTLTARYEGDTDFSASTSTPLSQVVHQDAGIEGVDSPPSVCAGEQASLTAQATGTGPFTFAWSESEDGVTFTPIPGATGATYTTPALSARRVYQVELEGACGTASKIVIVEVTQPPVITGQPSDAVVGSWHSATLTVTYTGTETVSIQWYEGETGDTSHPVPQATEAVFKTPSLDRDAVYWARLSNACATADTDAAEVTVTNVYYLPHAASTDLWWTTLDLVNAGTAAQPVSLDAYDSTGALLEHQDLDPVDPGSKRELDAGALFSASTLATDFWVKVTSKANLKGLLSFGTRDHTSRTALAFADEGHRQLVFPYVALTGPEAGAYYTGLTLVNVGTSPAAVTLQAFAESGVKLSEATVVIPPNGKYVRLLDQVFPGLADPQAIRSVTAASDQPLVGFELFGTLLAQGLSGLPAVRTDDPQEEGFYFGMCYAEIPPNAAWYTGMTFVNLDPKPARVTGMVYDAAGTLLGTESWDLQPMEQLTREVWELLDPAVYGTAAHAVVGSYQRVSGFELVLSRQDPFRFDGLAGIVQGSDRLVFPVVRTGAGVSTRIRLVNKSDGPMTAVMTAYDAAGLPAGTYPLALASRQALDLDVAATFPASGAVAWIGVEGDNILFGNAFILDDAGRTLVIYPGLAER